MAKKKDNIDHSGTEGEKNGPEAEPEFSDPEGFVDDINDEEFCGDLLRRKPREREGVESIIVVDGLPVVGEDRLEKLKGVVRIFFGKFGTITNEFFAIADSEAVAATMGTNTTLPTTYMFIEYDNAGVAVDAVKTMDGYNFDKAHTLLVNLFADFNKYENIPENWVTPQPQAYKDPGNLWYYLLEPDAFDQYLIIKLGISKGGMATNDLQIMLNSNPEHQEMLNRGGGIESIAKWSPFGTYLATFHGKGVAICGDKDFEKINRFAHPHAELIDFSPNEPYLVTFVPKAERMYVNSEVLIIWVIRTAAKKRTFSEIYKSPCPLLKWLQDDKYYAKMPPDTIFVYETQSFRLQDNKSLKIHGVRDFSWAPTDNILVYWVPEDKDVPARVTLQEIPSRNEVRAKNLFNVAECRMHWQKSGDFLWDKVDRYSKVKKEKHDTKYSGALEGNPVVKVHLEHPLLQSSVLMPTSQENYGFGLTEVGRNGGLNHVGFHFTLEGSSVGHVKKDSSCISKAPGFTTLESDQTLSRIDGDCLLDGNAPRKEVFSRFIRCLNHLYRLVQFVRSYLHLQLTNQQTLAHLKFATLFLLLLIVQSAAKEMSCSPVDSCIPCVTKNCLFVDVGTAMQEHWICLQFVVGWKDIRFVVRNSTADFCPDSPTTTTAALQIPTPTPSTTTTSSTTTTTKTTQRFLTTSTTASASTNPPSDSHNDVPFTSTAYLSIPAFIIAVVTCTGLIVLLLWLRPLFSHPTPLLHTFAQRRAEHRRELRNRYEVRNQDFLEHVRSLPPNYNPPPNARTHTPSSTTTPLQSTFPPLSIIFQPC